MAEGPDLVQSALEADFECEGVYVDERATSRVDEVVRLANDKGVRVFSLASGTLEKIADAQTPQPVLAAVRFPQLGLEDIEPLGCVVVAHDLRDPGNAGTIMRSADAAGATAVIFTGRSVDPYNPKTLRATAGSVFHLPLVVTPSLASVVAWASDHHVNSFASVVRGGQRPSEIDWASDCVIVIGNEATGLSEVDVALCTQRVTIPMVGRSESLNAGVAASLLLFEALEQRQNALAGQLRPTIEG